MAGALAMSAASAAPTCLTTNTLTGGAGIVLRSQITTGYCVVAKDKIYGNFNLGNLPASTVLIFNNNLVSGLTYYQLSFSATYHSNTTYHWGYEVAVAGWAPTGTSIVSLESDFTQTAGGLSTLDKTTSPTSVTAAIHMGKNGASLTSWSITSTTFGPGVTDLIISEILKDKGTVSQVTNTVVQSSPPQGPGVPEPGTLALLGAGLVGASVMRRKRQR
jgi:hypothetical protein